MLNATRTVLASCIEKVRLEPNTLSRLLTCIRSFPLVRTNAFHLNAHSGLVRLVHFGNRAVSLEQSGVPSSFVLRSDEFEESKKLKVKESLCYLGRFGYRLAMLNMLFTAAFLDSSGTNGKHGSSDGGSPSGPLLTWRALLDITRRSGDYALRRWSARATARHRPEAAYARTRGQARHPASFGVDYR